MEEITDEPEGLAERVCAIDIGKAAVVACVRVPHPVTPGRRVQEVREYATMTADLMHLAEWLEAQRVVAMAACTASKPIARCLTWGS